MTLHEEPTTAAERTKWNEAKQWYKARLARHERVAAQREARAERLATAVPGFGFAYDTHMDSYQSVLCADGLNPGNAASWVAAGNAAAKTGDAFGQIWTWTSVPCASWTWKAVDEDAYRGPFTRTTSAPVLVVGNWWDPATSYSGAKALTRLLPNSSLVSSNSWGHTALTTSDCVDTAVEQYLLTGQAKAGGVLSCTGDEQPFSTKLEDLEFWSLRQGDERRAVPVPVPGSGPRL